MARLRTLGRWIARPGGWGAAGLLVFGALPVRAAEAPDAGCLRCHGMATFAERNPETGRIRSLAVDAAAFHRSNHGELACTKCHNGPAASFPHRWNGRPPGLKCSGCHRDGAKFLRRRFPEIAAEHAASVHVKAVGAAFTCFACHDPHGFRVSNLRGEPAARDRVAAANAVCRMCHADAARLARFSARVVAPLAVAHRWLPGPDRHLAAVRCVECHAAGDAPALGHRILPASRAVRDCAWCHSRDPVLLDRLYRYDRRRAIAAGGIVNAVLLNDAYVVGATRHRGLDRASVVVFGFMVLGLAGHGALRWWTGRRRR